MKTVGIVLLLIGIIGALIFGIQAIQDTETFSFLGIDIGVSSANWTPVIVSGIIIIIGIVLMSLNKKSLAN
ncbi:MAG: transglycosylase [Marinilabilia sp.]